MTCRQTRLGSAITSYAMLAAGIEERQCLSTFHELQREGRNASAPTAAEISQYVTEMRALISQDANLSEARRASLLARLDAAASQPLDGRTFYAANRLMDRARRARSSMEAYLDGAARRAGVSVGDMRSTVGTDMLEAHQDRSLRAPREWQEQFAARPENAGLPLDRITAYAIHQAETRAAARAETRPTIRDEDRVPVTSRAVRSVGYHPESGRLEIEMNSRPGVYYAYRVPQEVYDDLMSGSVGSYYGSEIRSNPAYSYSTAEEHRSAGTLTRCGTCGQYAGDSHACPTRGSEQERVATERRAADAIRARRAPAQQNGASGTVHPNSITGQNRAVARAALDAGEAAGYRIAVLSGSSRNYQGASGGFRCANLTTVQAEARHRDIVNVNIAAMVTHVAGENGEEIPVGNWAVNGRVNVAYRGRGAGYGVTAVTSGANSSDADRLQCTCPDYRARYDCVHVRQVVQDVQARLNADSLRAPHGIGASVQEATVQVTADLAQDRADSVAAQAAAVSNWGDPASSPVRYTEDPAAFQADYKAAKDRVAAGEDPVPYMTENATDGLGAPGSGRGFGVELEFDIAPGVNRDAALRAIGRDLHAAGLTSTPHQGGYHNGQRNGYTTNHNGGWSYEYDGTVAGELVTPIMYDTPETWEKLNKALEIIKRHGGIASVSAGSHVHVGAGNYDHTVENHNRLSATFQEHQDLLYRLSTNWKRGTHRGTGYCTPNNVPAAGYRDIRQARFGNDRTSGLNLQSVAGHSNDHVEFRTWDASLDPGVIQTQIKVSLAMTEAAFRDRGYTPGRPEPLGTHRAANRAEHGTTRRLTGEAWRRDTESYRKFADQMFRRPADKAQVTALFAVTKWQRVSR